MTDPLEETVTRLLVRTFDKPVELLSLVPLTGGASQETYRVEAQIGQHETPYGSTTSRVFALRRSSGGRPHDPLSPYPGLVAEAELFRLAKEASIPEPDVLAILEPSDDLGPGFLLEWLDGETLGARIVRSESFATVRPKLARQCGEILGRLHAIDVQGSGVAEHLQSTSPEQFVRNTWNNYQELNTVQPMIDYAALWLLENLPAPCAPRLVHSDFRNGNLMVDAKRGIIAVLDWELAHLGDPMRDLGWLCCNSWRFGSSRPVGGFGNREELFAGYESTSGVVVDPEHVRFWEIFGSFWWAVGTLHMGQQHQDGSTGGIERLAIARRTSECQMDCVNLLFPGPFEVQKLNDDHDSRADKSQDLVQASELIAGVRDFLRSETARTHKARASFLSRVSANALDIVLREQALGSQAQAAESKRLSALGFEAPNKPSTEPTEELQHQRHAFVTALRSGSLDSNDLQLQDHLRQTVAQQLAIDQPRYSALRTSAISQTALEN